MISQEIWVVFVKGISTGIMYGLVGACFSTIFYCSGIVNFAQGSIAMLGGFASYLVGTKLGLPFPVVVTMVCVMPVFCSLLIYWLFAEPLVKANVDRANISLGVFGAAFIIQGIVGWLTDYRYFKVPSLVHLEPIAVVSRLTISKQYALIIGTSFMVVGAYYFFLYHTKAGLALRATGVNADLTSLSGINLSRVRTNAWVISGIGAGIAGALIAPLVVANALMGTDLIINAFIAAAIGGFGNPLAALVGGLAVGLVGSVSDMYITKGSGQAITLTIMLIFITFRPQGILGERE